jgi:hypothetical protein
VIAHGAQVEARDLLTTRTKRRQKISFRGERGAERRPRENGPLSFCADVEHRDGKLRFPLGTLPLWRQPIRFGLGRRAGSLFKPVSGFRMRHRRALQPIKPAGARGLLALKSATAAIDTLNRKYGRTLVSVGPWPKQGRRDNARPTAPERMKTTKTRDHKPNSSNVKSWTDFFSAFSSSLSSYRVIEKSDSSKSYSSKSLFRMPTILCALRLMLR